MSDSRYSLYKRPLKKGPVYYFRLRDDPKRVWHSTGTPRKGEAVEYVEAFIDGRVSKPETLQRFCDGFFIWGECEWIRRQHGKGISFSRTVAKGRRGHLANHILPRFGTTKARAIRRSEVEDWLASLPAIAQQTKKHILYTFRIVLDEAERKGVIVGNPLRRMIRFGGGHKRRDPFTHDDLLRLFPPDIAGMERIWGDRRWAALFHVIAATGIRQGEARALTWDRVFQDPPGLDISMAVKRDGSLGPTKTGEARVALLTTRAAATLRAWHDVSPHTGDGDLIFFGERGDKPLNASTVSKKLGGSMERAGVQVNERNLVVHSFRHTFNTISRQVLPDDVLRRLTGHSSERMTTQYDHTQALELLRQLASRAPELEEALTV